VVVRDYSRCPRCGAATAKAVAFNEGESEFWYECTRCNTFINTYIPQAHQEAVHRDTHRFVGNFGAYGSGKTLTDREELYKHCLITKNGNVLIGANVQSQYEATIKRDIEADIPKAFVKEFSTQKQYMDLVNGCRIMYRPFDDPNKLRSYNLTMFLMVEASEIKPEAFVQLKTRLRHTAATVPDRNEDGTPKVRVTKTGVHIPIIKADWRKGILESNPSAGWIRNDVLMKSSSIEKHGSVPDMYAVLKEEMDPAISSHVTVSDANEFLPPGFIEDVCKNKPAYWVARYVHGSFNYSDGLVYPSAMSHIVKTFDIPVHWKRIIAYDYGLQDNSVYLFGAVDPEKGKLYIYKEYVTNDKSIEQLAKAFHQETKDIPMGGMITAPIIDPKSGPKRDYDKKSLSDHFLDYGIAFKPGQVNVDAGIFRVNTYFESGVLKIMDCCTNLIAELRDYKFKPEAKFGDGWSDKPQDKNNHCVDPLRWICMELPADPGNLLYGVYSREGVNLALEEEARKETEYVEFLLSDKEEYSSDTASPFDIDYIY
jgi:phage terminase large subunit